MSILNTSTYLQCCQSVDLRTIVHGILHVLIIIISWFNLSFRVFLFSFLFSSLSQLNDKLEIISASFRNGKKRFDNKKQQNLNWNLLTQSFTNQALLKSPRNDPAAENEQNKR